MKKLNTLILVMLAVYCAFLGYQIKALKNDAASIEEGETVTVVNKTVTGFATDLTKVIDADAHFLKRSRNFLIIILFRSVLFKRILLMIIIVSKTGGINTHSKIGIAERVDDIRTSAILFGMEESCLFARKACIGNAAVFAIFGLLSGIFALLKRLALGSTQRAYGTDVLFLLPGFGRRYAVHGPA